MAVARPERIDIIDVCPRDGLQNDQVLLSTEAKVELVRRIAASGVRRIEITSFVHPKRVPQMADAEAIAHGVAGLPGVSLSALVLNARGFDRALTTPVHEINFAANASETFSFRNQGTTLAENLTVWRAISKRAAASGLFRCVTIAASFGCPFEGEIPVTRLAGIAAALADIGVDEISLADTIGVASPGTIERAFEQLAVAVPGMRLRAHLHNTRNTGYANAAAALRCGVAALDASLAGLGGCPFAPGATGNIATEDLVYMLDRDRVGHGARLEALAETTRWLEGVMGRRLPAHLAHVSRFPKATQDPSIVNHPAMS